VDSEIITVRTGSRPAVVDITSQVAAFASGRGDGLLHVFVPHAGGASAEFSSPGVSVFATQ